MASLLSLYIGSTYYYHSPLFDSVKTAIAVVNPTKGNTATGVVTFSQEKDGLHISAKISGLTPGKHGFHIHEFGNCACDDAVCTGGHFNPTNQEHNAPDALHRHIGDLGNILADAQGNATYEYIDKQTSLNGPDSIVGRAVIIHAQEDDFKTQPTGNAGARIGAGVIGIGKK
jgi:Cu-Zn family superoxide dismutase